MNAKSMKRLGFSFLLFTFYFLCWTSLKSQWLVEKIEAGFDINKYAIGDGRNDGINRVYVGQENLGKPGYIAEVSWQQDNWEVSHIDTNPEVYNSPYGYGDAITTIAIGDGKNDGQNRVYASYYYSKKINEFNWTGSSWTKTLVDLIDGNNSIITVGDARNDGIKRLYAGSAVDGILEYTWTGSSWTKATVLPEVGSVLSNLRIADGQGDGKQRLYVIGEKLSELTWTDTNGWQATNICNGNGLAIGDGRNDGINRIYSGGSQYSQDISEWTWNGTKWIEKFISNIESPIVLEVKDGRNDGRNRVYIKTYVYSRSDGVDWKSQLVEFSWDGFLWTQTDTSDYSGNDYAIIASPRNDNKNRLYTTGSGLLEYTWAYPQPAYDSSKTQQDKLQPVNNYFKQGSGWTTIWYKVDKAGDVSVKLYTTNGELVRTLFEGHKDVGEYSEVWTGRNDQNDIVGSGIYLVRLKAPGVNVTKKVCVVK
ncbi:MAG: FlgD immunoglobulin-like domain containing protein [Elusimicrobiota bacterium]